MNQKRLYALRGAVCTEDSPESIEEAVKSLFQQLYSKYLSLILQVPFEVY